MKNFLRALLFFLFWAVLGIIYLYKTDTFSSTGISVNSTENNFLKSKQSIEEKDDKDDSLAFEIANKKADSLIENSDQKDTSTLQNGLTNSEINIDTTSYSENTMLADELKKSFNSSKGAPKETKSSNIPSTSTRKMGDIIYPRYSNGELILDEKLIAYSKQLKEKMNSNPDIKVTIIGHTDNVGNDVDNYLIALERSRQIKWYLTTRLGISANKINAISRGETEPVYSNSKRSSRAKNNRIEIVID